jgi:hypothetical protein
VEQLVELLGQRLAENHQAPAGVDARMFARMLLTAAWVARLSRPGDKDWSTLVTDNVQVLWPSIASRLEPQGGRHGRA